MPPVKEEVAVPVVFMNLEVSPSVKRSPSAVTPPVKVDVPVDAEVKTPPDKVSPSDERIPPVPKVAPDANVEVAPPRIVVVPTVLPTASESYTSTPPLKEVVPVFVNEFSPEKMFAPVKAFAAEICAKVDVDIQPGIPPVVNPKMFPLVPAASSEKEPAEPPYMSSPIPIAPPAKLFPSIVPVQSPVALRVRAPPELERPVPKRELNDWPSSTRLPPEIRRPSDDSSPPKIPPPVKVEVPEQERVRAFVAERTPPVPKVAPDANVEVAPPRIVVVPTVLPTASESYTSTPPLKEVVPVFVNEFSPEKMFAPVKAFAAEICAKVDVDIQPGIPPVVNPKMFPLVPAASSEKEPAEPPYM